MKKISILAIVMLFTVGSFAQNVKVQTAYNHLKKGKLKDALSEIEPALEHGQTSTQAKTWFYYASICFEIANTKKDEYKNLLSDPLAEALIGYKKTAEFDKRGEYKDQISTYTKSIAYSYYSQGADAYEQRQFSVSADKFIRSFDIKKEYMSEVDTLTLYYAATSYYFDKQYDNSEKFFLQLKEMNYQESDIYIYLAKIALEKNNLEQAAAYIDEGDAKFPNNLALLTEKVNLYLTTDLAEFKKDEAEKTLLQLIKLDPTNHVLYYNLGISYSSDSTRIDEAIDAYQKAIELKSDYVNAYVNWANIYIEQSNQYVREANDLPIEEDKKYNELINKSKELLLKGLPHVEKAYELNPEDVPVRMMLRDLYIKLNMLDKAEALKM